MRLLRSPVLWFFVFTHVLKAIGEGINLYVVKRLTVPGAPLTNSAVSAWQPYGFYVTHIGPSLVGLIMTASLYGLPGVRRLAVQLTPWSVGRAWPVLAVALSVPLFCSILPFAILGTLNVSDLTGSWSLPLYLYGAVISGGLLGPGICEELGWRGFALPHLQRRYSALVSSLMIGAMWALWHWPSYFLASHPHPFWGFAAAIPMGMAVAILYTWVYNSTGGSLFAVVVLHGATVSGPSMSASASNSAGSAAAVIASLLYIIVAVGLVWRYGAENLPRREKVVAEPPNNVVNVRTGNGLKTSGGRSRPGNR